MRILLTNDDGIRAPGLIALHDALRETLGERITDLVVVAPLTVQSATSHGVTFHEPLMTRTVRASATVAGTAVDGRPADCTKVALTNLWPERFGEGSRPDLVISGMNMGSNAGINVIYSGTVAAAIEAAFMGVPSIAVSLHLHKGTPDYPTGAAHAAGAIQRILGAGLLDGHMCMNLNIPRCEEEDPSHAEPMEMVVCPMNIHGHQDRYERRVNPAGEVYYWSSGDGMSFRGADEGTDVEHLFERRITLTPLQYDLTNRAMLEKWRARLGGR
ncbi:MAG: 5'/3'-nucleotidase SurE [Phycisphaeraceae bacterium]|nr:MAG: 5'/3'-nucleotidase SurE [Phycisphaeraceae bacterium]